MGKPVFFFLFDSYSKDKIGRMSATGTAVLLKFDLFQQRCLENYIKSVYYSNYTENTKTIKTVLKSERKKKH